MSIRATCLIIIILILFIYAWKDWFKSLCCLIVLMAFIEHPDMPKSIMGIQGFNPWNFLIAGILLAWFVKRRQEGYVFDMPRVVKILLGLYGIVIIIGFLRLMIVRTSLPLYYKTLGLTSELLINTFKWTIPGFLLFDGCRSRKRVKIVLLATFLMGLFFAIQVARKIPPGYALHGDAEHRRLKLDGEVGYHSVDLSTILAGISWGFVAVVGIFRRRSSKILILLVAGFVVYAQALTGGRAGFLAWGFTGFVLCILKWRKYLLLSPIAVTLLIIALPGATERMLQGFGITNIAGEETIDHDKITSGRWLVWPYVIEEIGKSPITGYGRWAYKSTGLNIEVASQTGEAVSHPHNAYLELLLDNGFLGFLPVMIFYLVIIIYATKLFLNRTDTLFSAVGGITLAFVIAQLVGSIGAQSFYPRESTLAMWCMIGLTIRMTVERLKTKTAVFDHHYQYNPFPAVPQTAQYSNLT